MVVRRRFAVRARVREQAGRSLLNVIEDRLQWDDVFVGFQGLGELGAQAGRCSATMVGERDGAADDLP